MKKLILFVAALFTAASLSAQKPFTGNMIEKDMYHYEDNFDVIVEQAKKHIDDDKSIDAATKAMAKMMIKPIVKNYLKKLDDQKYLTSFPEGEFLTLMKVDPAGNRSIAFTPDLGRIFLKDGNTGRLIIAYPNLKIALDVTDPTYQNNSIQETCRPTPVNEAEVEIVDGYRCIPNYALVAYDSVGGDLIDTMTVNGVLMVKLPMAGWCFADWSGLKKQQNISNEYYTSEISIPLLQEAEVNPANFVFPEGYKIFTEVDKITKELMKAVKKGNLATPYGLDQIPDVIWDIFK